MLNPLPPLLAFGFGSLPMLGWMAAAAAPILIHLWNKRKYREVSWAAIEFLLAAMRRNARRIQLMQWLLLAVRTALILCVALAMAEPFIQTAGLSFVPGQRTHKVIVLDGSYSMGYRPTDSSRFARAQQLARQIVDESEQGDGFTLVLMSSPSRVIVGTPAFEPRSFTEEIEALKLPHTGGDVAGAVAQVKEIVSQARTEQPALVRTEVFFLTDLGRNSWAPEAVAGRAGGETAAAPFHRAIAELAESASLIVLDLGQSAAENVAVTSLASREPFATLWRDLTFQAQVKNFGSQPRTRHLVELIVDDSRVKEEYVDLEPGGEATVSFTHRFEAPGYHVVRIRTGPDLLEVDNSRWLSVNVKQQLKTLIVSGKQGETRYVDEALYVPRNERALTQTRVVPESALMELDLEEFDCIFLCNVAQFTSGEARLLEAYLKHGGGLVFFLGDRVLAERYNRELAGEEAGVQVLPARLGAVVAEAQYRLDPLNYAHPIVEPFRGRERSGLLTLPIYRYFKLIVPAQWTGSRVALAFEGGDPAIVEAPLHRGRSVLVATAASTSSIDPISKTPWIIPQAPGGAFLPIVQKLLSIAVGSQAEQFNALVGEPLGTALASSATTTVHVTPPGPDPQKIPVAVQAALDETRWTFDKTEQYGSGIYRAELGGMSAVPFAVNVNAGAAGEESESDLRKADPDDLPRQLLVQTEWQDLDEQPVGEISRRDGLQRWLLYAALVLALAEVYLAWRFGRGGP